MEKIKVGVLAKELNKTAKELLSMLKDLGISAKTSASSIDSESAKIVKDLVLSPKAPQKTVSAKKEDPKKTKEVKLTEEKPRLAETKPKEVKTKIEEPRHVEEKPKVEEKPAAPQPIVQAPPVQPAPATAPQKVLKEIKIQAEGIILKDFADLLNLKTSEIIKELMRKGILATLNQKISSDIAKEIGEKFAFSVVIDVPPPASDTEEIIQNLIKEDEKDLKHRPPVVAVMGHVDHGKTKLLDAIRSTKVAESEAGGITQHIGAYQVQVKGKKITFLDTPGHEAFTALRARGAKSTDIAVLVVAADDGVMPQTIEAIDHAKAAGVPIIVAINKIDKPDANPDRVKQQLSEHGLQPEDWGGSTVTVPISAKQRTGIDDLLEMILLVADMQDLRANPNAPAFGIVVESKLDKGRGPVSSILIKNGTLYIGDHFVIGYTYGKIRALISDKGERIKKAPPSTPVEILGANDVPPPGELLYVTKSDKEAKDLAEKNRLLKDKASGRHRVTLEDYSKDVEKGEKQDLNLILKADVQGSLEALVSSLREINVEDNKVNIVHSGVGNIAESDVLLAEASNAILIGFSVEISPRAKEIAETENVNIKEYNIIYKLLDDVKLAMEGMLKPEYEEVVIGTAEVRQTFKFSKVGVIAGCFILSGKMIRGSGLRIFRGEEKVYEGKLESLKRFKEDVREVSEGYECGIAIVGYEDFKPGDKVEAFEVREKKRL